MSRIAWFFARVWFHSRLSRNSKVKWPNFITKCCNFKDDSFIKPLIYCPWYRGVGHKWLQNSFDFCETWCQILSTVLSKQDFWGSSEVFFLKNNLLNRIWDFRKILYYPISDLKHLETWERGGGEKLNIELIFPDEWPTN